MFEGGDDIAVDQAIRVLTDPERRMTTEAVGQAAGLREAGLYAWFVDEVGAADLTRGLGGRVPPGLIYAGQTGAGTSSATLRARVVGNHARGNIRSSTFRLTLAAALSRTLALRPTTFRHTTPDGEARLTTWIANHLIVTVYPFADRQSLLGLEAAVIERLDPPLNLDHVLPTPIRAALTAGRRPYMAAPKS